MTWRLVVGLSLVVVCLTGPAAAQDLADLYDPRALDADQDRYASRLDELLRVRLWSFFTSEEQAAFGALQLQVPLVGESGTPFDFYAVGSGGAARVVMPVLSLKFVEDLSLAYAWL